ncbi:hypothetical protein BDV23DRAFT_178153 [Aspergillus alliaceus]|uniref:Ankyrin repeat-containing domain protein n=1 Tax=Petromyces alliaceus TaxID=209559 RepID=A0A5N7CPQ8_PETAA|nr:hypothetical protein BDV23DRAFT_178153 [Aspergillus alliaceus]
MLSSQHPELLICVASHLTTSSDINSLCVIFSPGLDHPYVTLWAAANGKEHTLRLATQIGNDLNVTESYGASTPTRFRHVSCVEILMAEDINVHLDIRERELGLTALQYAARSTDLEIMKLFLR